MQTPAWHELTVARDAERYSDLAAEAADNERMRREQAEMADVRTRQARELIGSLARTMTEEEACALISALSNAIEASPFSHLARGKGAVEGLMDAHWSLENEHE